MIHKFAGFLASTCLVFSLHSFAVNSNPADVNEKGKALYQQCVACHGQNGEGNEVLKSPALAGQFDWYLAKQITNFANGIRGSHKKDSLGKQMLPMVKDLDPQNDIPKLAAYIQDLPVVKVQFTEPGNMTNGSRYYQGKCGACHGGTAQGNKSLNAPKLTGLSNAYLLRQMANFSEGIRGYKLEDKLGRQMAMMAKTTSGQELNDIIFYIRSQENLAANK